MTRTPFAARPWTGAALVVGSTIFFGINGVVSKVALQAGLATTQLVQLRTLGAALTVLAVAALVSPRGLRITLVQARNLAILGVVGVALVMWLYLVAIERLHVGIALLLEYTAPLLVALFARFVLKERVRSRVWLALALSLTGLTMVAQVGRGVSLDAVGVAAALGAALALATYFLLGERLLRGIDPWATSAWSMSFAALFWTILAPPWRLDPTLLGTAVTVPQTTTALPLWVFVMWVAVLGTAVPFTLVILGLRMLGAARTGLVGTLEPVLAGAFAWALLAEAMTPLQVLGGAVVVVGVMLAETARTRRATAPAGPVPALPER